ncbi:MAG TPA: PAS domain S-box protein [Armatimonadota bacterium]
MTLRIRTLAAIGLALAALMGILYWSLSRIVVHGFVALEERSTQAKTQQIVDLMESDLATLDIAAADWGSWLSATSGPQDALKQITLLGGVDSVLNRRHVDLVLLVDARGKTIFGRANNPSTGRPEPIPGPLLAALKPGGALSRSMSSQGGVRGFVPLADDSLMVAIRSCSVGRRSGDRSTLVLGQYLEPGRTHRLARLSSLGVSIRPLATAALSPEEREQVDPLLRGRPLAVRQLDPSTVRGMALLRDPLGRPALLLRADAPREIYHRAQSSVRSIVFSLALVGVAFALVILLLLERLVLSRLASLSNGVARISQDGALDVRLEVRGTDELSGLALAINEMLSNLQGTLESLRRSQAAQAKSESLYRDLFENARDLVFAVTPVGRITAWNRAGEQITGYQASEAIGMNLLDLVAPEDRARVAQGLHAGDLGQPGTPLELRVTRKTGGERLLDLGVRPLGAAGILEGFEGIARDITDRRRLEEAYLQSQKMEALGRLASGVAHDFNNMLAVISGYCELLIRRLPQESDLLEALQEIRGAAQRSASLTRQLLTFSRRQVLSPMHLNLNETVRGMEKMLHRLIGEDVELRAVLDEGLGDVVADPSQIEQLVLNLAVNARDAMPDGGILTLTTREATEEEVRSLPDPRDSVLLEVRDTGCGMDGETLDRVFEPFFTTKELGHGTGLGLATVYAIVEQSGGHIRLSSAPGNGTSFQVFLPRATVKESRLAGRADSDAPSDGTETVLLAEDETKVRALARDILRMSGYKVLEAPSPSAALDLCRTYRQEIHLLLTDVVMPQMSGPELAAKVTEFRPSSRVLFMSGYADDAALRRGVSEQALSFLPKPFTPDSLTRKVREVLDATDR